MKHLFLLTCAALLLALAGPRPLTAQSFIVFSDFDGDHRLDKVELVSAGSGKSIHVTFGDSRTSPLHLHLLAFDPGHLLVTDIDHDKALDLIWVSETQPGRALVWLGDGRGHFGAAKDILPYAAQLHRLLQDGPGFDSFEGPHRNQAACASVPSDSFARTRSREFRMEIPPGSVLAVLESHRDLSLRLACLRERAPPSHLS